MPNRNRLLDVAIRGLVIALYLAWFAPIIGSFVPSLEYDAAQYVTDEKREQGRQDQDTYAQIWMAWAAWAQAGIGLAGLIGLGLTVYFARLAYGESRRGAQAAIDGNERAAERFAIERRPWIQVTIEQSDILPEFDGDEETIVTLSVTMKNVGLSPAANVRLLRTRFDQRVFGGSREQISAHREHVLSTAFYSGFLDVTGYNFFPGEQHTDAHRFILERPRFIGSSIISGLAMGWIAYREPGQDQVYSTPFAMDLLVKCDADGRIESWTAERSFYVPPPT